MHRLFSAMCWLIFGTGLVFAYAQTADEARLLPTRIVPTEEARAAIDV